jgi:predicted enzyme related to lactoylglutathione lyase
VEQVDGVGGVFIRSGDPERLRAWYADHLGIESEDWGGRVFTAAAGQTFTWAVFPGDTDYFPGPVMINFRVRDLDALLAQLRAAGVDVDPNVMDHENGRFGWALDCDGNRVELWEPAPEQ